jgi:hypothetical protein
MPTINATAGPPLMLTKLAQKQQCFAKHKPRVRFASASQLQQVELTISRLDMSDDEIHACWWTSEENDTSRQHARMILQRTKQQPQSKAFIAKTLDRSYQKACVAVSRGFALGHRHPFSDEDVAEICKSEQLLGSKSLRLWASYCEGRRGLEGYLCNEERQTQSAIHRQLLLSKISDASAGTSLRSDDGNDSNCSVVAPTGFTYHHELIAQLSIQSSAISRVFARMMGEADVLYVIEHC